MTSKRLRTTLASGGLTALAATALLIGAGGGSSPAVAADPTVYVQADALSSAPTPDGFDTAAPVTGAAAAARGQQLAGAVPLPPGEAFDDIRWGGLTVSDAEVEGLLEFNAACKWWIADADAPTKETSRVVHTIQSWPTMRGGDRHRAALSFVRAGDEAFASDTLAFCRASVK